MKFNTYTAPESELIRITPDGNFVSTTGGGTGEDVGVGGPEEEW